MGDHVAVRAVFVAGVYSAFCVGAWFSDRGAGDGFHTIWGYGNTGSHQRQLPFVQAGIYVGCGEFQRPAGAGALSGVREDFAFG